MNFQLFFLLDSSPPKSVLEISLISLNDGYCRNVFSTSIIRFLIPTLIILPQFNQKKMPDKFLSGILYL